MACIIRFSAFVRKDHSLPKRSINTCCCVGMNSIYNRPFLYDPSLSTASLLCKDSHRLLRWSGLKGPVTSQSRIVKIHTSFVCKEKSPPKSEELLKSENPNLGLEVTNKGEVTEVAKPKKSIGRRIIDEIKHYYHGFRLLFIDIKISSKLLWRIINGDSLSRREHNQLVRTVSDLFRLVPFSVFILVPFMEFLLPVALKLFPSLLPSTFQSSNEREAKMQKALKVKIEMAKFLQDTLNGMALQAKGHESETAKKFVKFFEKVRSSGAQASNDEILQFSKLFEDEITLDSLSRPQLVALSKVLELQTFGTNNILRFQIRMRLRSLRADDKMIMKEGIGSLSVFELQQACKARGMRAYGLSKDRLQSQLSQWLVLSLNEKVPPSLLLLSRTLYLSDNLPTEDQLIATISALPDSVVIPTKAAIAEKEGKIDNKAKLDVIREEEAKIKEEKAEKARRESELKEKALQEELQRKISLELAQQKVTDLSDIKTELADHAELLVDKAPIIQVAEEPMLTKKDFLEIENALEKVSKQRKEFIIEKEVLEELRTELSDYAMDIKKLEETIEASIESKQDLRQSKGAKRLYKKVHRMLSKLEKIVGEVESKDSEIKEVLSQEILKSTEKKPDQLIGIDELLDALSKLQDIPDKAKMNHIAEVISKMDADEDGKVKVEDILHIIEVVSEDDLNVKTGQLNEIIELLMKEEVLSSVQKETDKAIESNSAQVLDSQNAEKL